MKEPSFRSAGRNRSQTCNVLLEDQLAAFSMPSRKVPHVFASSAEKSSRENRCWGRGRLLHLTRSDNRRRAWERSQGGEECGAFVCLSTALRRDVGRLRHSGNSGRTTTTEYSSLDASASEARKWMLREAADIRRRGDKTAILFCSLQTVAMSEMGPVGGLMTPGAQRSLQYGVALAKEQWLQRLSLVVLLFQVSLSFLRILAGDRWGALSHFLLCYCGYLASQDRLPNMVVALYCLWSIVTACELLFLAVYLKKFQGVGTWGKVFDSNSVASPSAAQPDTEIPPSKIASYSQFSSLIVIIFSPLADLASTILMYKLHKLYESAEDDTEASGNLIPFGESWQSGRTTVEGIIQSEVSQPSLVPLSGSPPGSADARRLSRDDHGYDRRETASHWSEEQHDVVPSQYGAEGAIQGNTDSFQVRIATIGDPSALPFIPTDGYSSLLGPPDDSPGSTDQGSGGGPGFLLDRQVTSVFQEPELVTQLLSRRLAQDAYNPFQGPGMRLKNSSSVISSGSSTPLHSPAGINQDPLASTRQCSPVFSRSNSLLRLSSLETNDASKSRQDVAMLKLGQSPSEKSEEQKIKNFEGLPTSA